MALIPSSNTELCAGLHCDVTSTLISAQSLVQFWLPAPLDPHTQMTVQSRVPLIPHARKRPNDSPNQINLAWRYRSTLSIGSLSMRCRTNPIGPTKIPGARFDLITRRLSRVACTTMAESNLAEPCVLLGDCSESVGNCREKEGCVRAVSFGFRLSRRRTAVVC